MEACLWGIRLSGLGLFLSVSAYGILPLPLPTEAPPENAVETVSLPRDPRTIQGYTELYAGSQLREMELPLFGNQSDALGYPSEDTFHVPPALRTRVEFWKRIYSEFTSSQGVLHDSEYPELVYAVVDLTELTRTPASQRKRSKLVSRFLKDEKSKIAAQLKTLHELQSDPLKIPPELFPLFKKFENIPGQDRFLMAADRVRMQTGQRDRIVQGFLYGGRYFSKLMEIFEKKKVPKELTRLPLVESAFNLNARSKVGASGVWQFMQATGKRFLRIDSLVDERNDPETAAWAAADLLRQNYEALGSWPLAITAYNHGREGMARAVRELGTTDLSEIIKRYKVRNFGFASSNFYSEFLAMLEVEREYRKHFGKLLVDAPLTYEEFSLAADTRFSTLAEACRLKHEQLEALNPALTDPVISDKLPVPRGYRLKVPTGMLASCESGYRNVSKLIFSPKKRTKLSVRTGRKRNRQL